MVGFILFGPIPFLLPGVIVSLVIGLISARWLGSRLRVSPWVAVLLVVGIGIIVSATLTPLRDALDEGIVGRGTCDFSRWWPISPFSFRRFFSDPVRNVLMFIPLGIAIALVPRSRAKAVLLVGAVVSPFVIETIQMLAPVLARGCESADVVDNLTGLVIGLVAGAIVARLGIGRPSGSATLSSPPDADELPKASR